MNADALDRYWLVARDKPGLLFAMMRQLAGDAHISLEGDLARCVFPQEMHPTFDETDSLRRHTAYPIQDFVVLGLSTKSVQLILDVILPQNRYKDDVIHIQIEKHGHLQFGSYDQFHHECIVAFPPSVTSDLLDRLKASGVIREWSVPHKGARRWHG